MRLVSDEIWRRAVYKPKRLDIADWSVEHMVLPNSAFGKRIILERTPWIVPVMEAYVDPSVHTIICSASAQTGKTLSLICCLAWSLVEEPSSVIIGLNTEQMAGKFCRTIMNPYLNHCQPVVDVMPRKAGRGNSGGGRLVDSITFESGNFLMVGPANDTFMRAWTARRLFGDEVAKWNSGGLANAIARTTTFPNRKIMLCSTPLMEGEGAEGDEFAQAWKRGSRSLWAMKCLACGALVPCKFKECIVWSQEANRGDMDWDYEKVASSARLRCSKCGHLHEQTPSNVAKMNAGGAYIDLNRNPVKGIKSFRFNKISAHSSIDTWGSLAVKFLEGKKAMYEGDSQNYIDFFTLDLGEPFVLAEDLGEAKMVFSAGGKKDGAVFEGKYLRTCGVDVQKGYWIAVVRDWDENGNSVLREAARLESEPDILDLVGRWEIAPNFVGIDCAFQRTQTLWFCAKNRFRGVQGYTGTGINAIWKKYNWQRKKADGTTELLSRPFSPDKVEKMSRRRGVSRGRGKYIEMNSHAIGLLLCRLRDGRVNDVRWETPEKAVESIGKAEYRRQILAVRTQNKLTPNNKRYQDLVNVSSDDHFFDAEKLSLMLAMRGGVIIP